MQTQVELTATRVRWRPAQATAAAFLGAERLVTNTPCGYFVNPYLGCAMRCLYCGTGAQGISEPIGDADAVRTRLTAELAAVPPWENLGVGASADAYPAAEAEHGITRAAIEVLVEQGRYFTVVTKGPLVLRDVDLLAGRPEVEVQVSISSVDEVRLGPLEPGAAPAGERIALVEELDRAGVRVSVSGRPWIPGVSDAAELFAALPAHVPITMGVLDVVLPEVPLRPFGRGWDQATLNAAYLVEIERVGTPDNVGWFAPTPPAGDVGSVYEYVAAGPLYWAWMGDRIRSQSTAHRAHTAAG